MRWKLIGFFAFGLVLTAPWAAVAAPELSVSERLQDRRYDVAGERARLIGFEDGRFYANGWHITGEMGGLWTEPLKLVDGVWFGIDGEWVGRATRFTSGWGYAKFDLPSAGGLRLERTDFAPDGQRAALFGLKMTNPATSSRTVTVKVDAHSELMTEYPWGFTGVTPNAADNLPDSAQYDDQAGALVFRDQGKLPHPNAPEHDYAAMVASTKKARCGRDRRVSERVPRAAGDERLHGRGAPKRVRRRSVRQGQGRAAALCGHRAGQRLQNSLGRRGGLRQGAHGGSARARGRPSRSDRTVRGQGR